MPTLFFILAEVEGHDMVSSLAPYHGARMKPMGIWDGLGGGSLDKNKSWDLYNTFIGHAWSMT